MWQAFDAVLADAHPAVCQRHASGRILEEVRVTQQAMDRADHADHGVVVDFHGSPRPSAVGLLRADGCAAVAMDDALDDVLWCSFPVA
jgi:hypothetical protein